LFHNPPFLAPGAPMALPPWQGSFWSGQISLFLWQAGLVALLDAGHSVCRRRVEIKESFSSKGCFCSGTRLVWNSLNSKKVWHRILLAGLEFLSTASVDHVGMYGVTSNHHCFVTVPSRIWRSVCLCRMIESVRDLFRAPGSGLRSSAVPLHCLKG
jgi:hypothetical protein